MHFANDGVLSNKPKIIVMEIGKRDQKIDFMQNLLKQREEQMYQHYRMCKGCIQQDIASPSVKEDKPNIEQPKCENMNSELMEIVKNYKTYYNEQLHKKEEQLMNMKNINSHLDNLLNNKELSHENINKIQHEQKDMMEQLNNLDEEINDLTKKID